MRGQIALAKLIRTLEPEQITGRVIILPAANLPAAMAGTRVSPIDGGNLNREFPGNPEGTVTSRIAHYIESVLLPMCDGFHDLHSGGASLQYSALRLDAPFRRRRSRPPVNGRAPRVRAADRHGLVVQRRRHLCRERRQQPQGGESRRRVRRLRRRRSRRGGARRRWHPALPRAFRRAVGAGCAAGDDRDAADGDQGPSLLRLCPRPWAVRARDRAPSTSAASATTTIT